MGDQEWIVERYDSDGEPLARAYRYTKLNRALAAIVRSFERQRAAAAILFLAASPVDGEPEAVAVVYAGEERGKVAIDLAMPRDDVGMSAAVSKAQQHVPVAFRSGVKASRHGTEWSTR